MFQKRLSGDPIGFSVLGIFVINKTNIPTVRVYTDYTNDYLDTEHS